MNDAVLSVELSKRIFGNLGIIPGQYFGKAGITLPEFRVDKRIKSANTDDGSVVSHDVYMAETILNTKYEVAFVNLESIESPDFLMVTRMGDFIFSITLSYDSMSAAFVQMVNETWVALNMLQKLNLTVVFEALTQEGMIWNPIVDQNYMFELLHSFE